MADQAEEPLISNGEGSHREPGEEEDIQDLDLPTASTALQDKLQSPSISIWLLTFSAGISGLLFGCKSFVVLRGHLSMSIMSLLTSIQHRRHRRHLRDSRLCRHVPLQSAPYDTRQVPHHSLHVSVRPGHLTRQRFAGRQAGPEESHPPGRHSLRARRRDPSCHCVRLAHGRRAIDRRPRGWGSQFRGPLIHRRAGAGGVPWPTGHLERPVYNIGASGGLPDRLGVCRVWRSKWVAVDGGAGSSPRWGSVLHHGTDAREPQMAGQGWKARRCQSGLAEGVWDKQRSPEGGAIRSQRH